MHANICNIFSFKYVILQILENVCGKRHYWWNIVGVKASAGEDPGAGEWTLAVRNWMKRLRNSTSSSIQDPGEAERTLVVKLEHMPPQNSTLQRKKDMGQKLDETPMELHITSVELARKTNPLELYIFFVIRIQEEKSGR